MRLTFACPPAIGYGSPTTTTQTASFIRWQTLHNVSVGNVSRRLASALRNESDEVCSQIILSVAGLIPGYWVSFLFIDSWGRKPIQLMGFIMLTITVSSFSKTLLFRS